jgi:hypothetical protein
LRQVFWSQNSETVVKYAAETSIQEELRMGRPVGVTILAILNLIGAAFCIIGGLLMIAGGGFLATMVSQQNQAGSAGAAGFFAGLGAFMGIFIIIIGGVGLLVGIGLLKLKEWARIISIVFAGLGAGLQLLGLVGSLSHFNIGAVIWTLFWLAIDVLIIWYLVKPEVKAAFQRPQIRAAGA